MEPEVVKTEPDNTQVENNTTTTTEQKQTVVDQETPEQINWRKFREAREIERKQKNEAEKRAADKEQEVQAYKAAMEALLNKQTPQASHDSNSEYQDQTEDQRIRQQVESIIAERDKKYAEERYRREQAELPQKLTTEYKDFNQVCSESNIDYMEYHYPEIYNAFKQMPDGYDKWANIYKAVKKLVPNTDTKKDQSKAEKNFQKPQAMSIAGKTQVGDTAPMNLDDKRKMDNWSRMQKVLKGGG